MAERVLGDEDPATDDRETGNPFVQGAHFHIDIPENEKIIEPDNLSLDLLQNVDASNLNGRTPHQGTLSVIIENYIV
jgi:hypothetical protein